jgi:hypothetical protein
MTGLRFWPLLFAALALIPAGCRPDRTAPQMNVVFPIEGDTLDPGSYEFKVWAVDDQRMWGVEFWEGGEMLGIDMNSTDDTWRMGWDCRNDTQRLYVITINADDYGDNWLTRRVSFLVRRWAVQGCASRQPGWAGGPQTGRAIRKRQPGTPLPQRGVLTRPGH